MNIVISGTVGIGKSTISRELSKKLISLNKDVFLYKELNRNNPYLELYYKDRPSWSFIIQLDFLMNRFINSYSIENKTEKINIFDRHFLDDYIFSTLPKIKDDMSNIHYISYEALNKELADKLKKKSKIDYFFLLEADFNEVLKRIKKRGRKEEKDVDLDYWNSLYKQYYTDKKIKKYINDNVDKLIVIDTNNKNINKIVNEILDILKIKY